MVTGDPHSAMTGPEVVPGPSRHRAAHQRRRQGRPRGGLLLIVEIVEGAVVALEQGVGLARRTATFSSQAVGRQGGLTDLCEAMSALPLISSALPPTPDILVAVTDFRF